VCALTPFGLCRSGVDFRKIGVWLSTSDVVMSWLRHEVHPTSISYVYKVIQHLDMLWMGT
jgi:hypothetical protein